MLFEGMFFWSMNKQSTPPEFASMNFPDFQSGRNAPSSGVAVGHGYAPEYKPSCSPILGAQVSGVPATVPTALKVAVPLVMVAPKTGDAVKVLVAPVVPATVTCQTLPWSTKTPGAE